MPPAACRRIAVLFSFVLISPLPGGAPTAKPGEAVAELEARGGIVARANGQPRVLELDAHQVALPVSRAGAIRLPAGADRRESDALRQLVRLPAGMKISQAIAPVRVEASGEAGRTSLTEEFAAPVFYEPNRKDDPAARYVGTTELLLVGATRALADRHAEATGAVEVAASATTELWLLRYRSAYQMLAAARRLGQQGVEVEPQLARSRRTRAAPNDPLYGQQFYFKNTGQDGGTAGVDLNIESLWPAASGAGITVAVVDDGLELTHPDLAPNVVSDASLHRNALLGGNDPTPPAASNHGTVCAGFIAARGNNGLGLTGAAPWARLLGVRLLGGDATDAQEAIAFGWKTDVVSVSNNSWGPDDDAKTVSAPDTAALAALRAGVTTGRGGRGVVYLVAAGNGREAGDHGGYDGYSGSRYVIAVGATDNTGRQAAFSESSPQLLVTAIGQTREGSERQLLATDNVGPRGENKAASPEGDYTTSGTEGTSYATPQVAGVVALMLEANPRLGWRDVKEILIRTARQNDATDSGWITNGGGFRFNPKHGAGFVDAAAAVAWARTWTNLPPEVSATQSTTAVVAIPDNAAAGAAQTLTLASGANLRVETVEVTVSVAHANRGQLQFELTSPAGTRTQLGIPRATDTGANFTSWTFSSPRHWGERSSGAWTVRVIDTVAGTEGALTAVAVTVYGAPAAAPTGPVIATQPGSAQGDVGGSVSISVVATGTGVLTYQWRKNAAPIAGATAATLVLNNLTLPDGGSYDVVVTDATGSTTSAAATLNVIETGPTARLGNLSVRTSLGAGQALTVGFVVSGGAKPVLIRAIGPTLAAFGVGGAHPDPTIELYSGSTKIDENDDWNSALTSAFADVGAFPLTPRSLDAALRRSISGEHTARIAGNGSGVILLEAYDAGTGNSPRIVNVSARNHVGTGDDILIAGLVVAGSGSKRVLIRAVGPTLASFGVGGVLADPKLEIFKDGSTKVAENDDWPANLSSAFTAAGAFQLVSGGKDAAIILTVTPGNYTVQVRGADGGTGEALIEVYDLDP